MLPEADNSRLVTVHLTDNSSSHSEAASPKEHTFAIDQLLLDTTESDLEEDEAEEEPEEDAYRLEIPSTNLGAMVSNVKSGSSLGHDLLHLQRLYAHDRLKKT